MVIPEQLLIDLNFEDAENTDFVFSKTGQPGKVPVSANYFSNLHRCVLKALNIRGRYGFYSWKHTGAVMCAKSGVDLKSLQLQLRHHSLDMVNEYLKNMGIADSSIGANFPSL